MATHTSQGSRIFCKKMWCHTESCDRKELFKLGALAGSSSDRKKPLLESSYGSYMHTSFY